MKWTPSVYLDCLNPFWGYYLIAFHSHSNPPKKTKELNTLLLSWGFNKFQPSMCLDCNKTCLKRSSMICEFDGCIGPSQQQPRSGFLYLALGKKKHRAKVCFLRGVPYVHERNWAFNDFFHEIDNSVGSLKLPNLWTPCESTIPNHFVRQTGRRTGRSIMTKTSITKMLVIVVLSHCLSEHCDCDIINTL